jgi:hypothetical protein
MYAYQLDVKEALSLCVRAVTVPQKTFITSTQYFQF